MTIVQSLLDLQEVDGRIRVLEQELKDLPRRRATEMARLAGVGADLQAAEANQECTNRRIKDFEDEVAAKSAKIQELKKVQLGLKTNKEYQDFSIQIDMVTRDLEASKANAEAAREFLPEAEKVISNAKDKYDAEKGGVDALCAEIDARIEAVKNELGVAQAERAEKAKLVSPQALLTYERLRTKRWPVVVQLTRDCVCDGCHIVQPPSVSQLVDHNASLVVCNMCGRILYRD